MIFGAVKTAFRKEKHIMRKQIKVRIANKRESVGDWLEFWLENYARPGIRQSTYEVYYRNIHNHLLPHLGNISLVELSAAEIQLFLRNLQQNGNRKSVNKGLSAETVVCIRNLLKSALEQAVHEGKIQRNPARQTKPPRVEQREMSVLTQEEMSVFLQHVTESPYYAIYVLTLSTGIRRGEVLGLPWKSVQLGYSWEELDRILPWEKMNELSLWDTEALSALLRRKRIRLREDPCIVISQQLSDLQLGPQLTQPKTKRSHRTIGIPMETAMVLLFHRMRQRMKRNVVGNSQEDLNLVFCDNLGNPLNPRNFTRYFQKELQNNDIRKIRFHDLRHTVATMLLEDGKAINTVQEILGHYNPAFTAAQYGHVTSRMQHEATETLALALKKARTTAGFSVNYSSS